MTRRGRAGVGVLLPVLHSHSHPDPDPVGSVQQRLALSVTGGVAGGDDALGAGLQARGGGGRVGGHSLSRGVVVAEVGHGEG